MEFFFLEIEVRSAYGIEFTTFSAKPSSKGGSLEETNSHHTGNLNFLFLSLCYLFKKCPWFLELAKPAFLVVRKFKFALG